MTTKGIEAVFLETHNWGKAAKFFQGLGFELDFSTDHASGQFRNGDGPYVFVAEVPEDREPQARIVLKVPDEDAFRPDTAVEVVTPFEDTHYGTREMTVRDPDGRLWILQARPRVVRTSPQELVVSRSDGRHDGEGWNENFQELPGAAGVAIILESTSQSGAGPRLHKHQYAETFIIRRGSATFTIGSEQLTGRAGQVLVAPAETPHKFSTGPDGYEAVHIHANPHFVTDWLE